MHTVQAGDLQAYCTIAHGMLATPTLLGPLITWLQATLN